MGAISDAVVMGSYLRAKQWLCAVAVAMLGFAASVGVGWIDPAKTLYSASKLLWLSALVGGGLFGFGMVMASGCGSKTLVRLGAGNLKSVVVFLTMGLAAFATLKGMTAVLRVATVDTVQVDLGANFSLSTWVSGVMPTHPWVYPTVGCVLAVLLLSYCFADAEFRRVEHWLGGVGVGLVVASMWLISGKLGFVAEHPETLQTAYLTTSSGRMESMSFVAPIAHSLDWVMFYSDRSKVLTFGVASVAGVVVGSLLTALLTRTFRWEGFRDANDTGFHLVGAVLMGVGGVTAMGCTVGQGLSGLSTLSFMSALAVVGIIGGAIAALKCQIWLLAREH